MGIQAKIPSDLQEKESQSHILCKKQNRIKQQRSPCTVEDSGNVTIPDLEDRVATNRKSFKESEHMIFHSNYQSSIKTTDNTAHAKNQEIFLKIIYFIKGDSGQRGSGQIASGMEVKKEPRV